MFKKMFRLWLFKQTIPSVIITILMISSLFSCQIDEKRADQQKRIASLVMMMSQGCQK